MDVLLVLIGLMLLTVFVVAIGDKIGLPWPALLTIITACAVSPLGAVSVPCPTRRSQAKKTSSTPTSIRRSSSVTSRSGESSVNSCPVLRWIAAFPGRSSPPRSKTARYPIGSAVRRSRRAWRVTSTGDSRASSA